MHQTHRVYDFLITDTLFPKALSKVFIEHPCDIMEHQNNYVVAPECGMTEPFFSVNIVLVKLIGCAKQLSD